MVEVNQNLWSFDTVGGSFEQLNVDGSGADTLFGRLGGLGNGDYIVFRDETDYNLWVRVRFAARVELVSDQPADQDGYGVGGMSPVISSGGASSPSRRVVGLGQPARSMWC